VSFSIKPEQVDSGSVDPESTSEPAHEREASVLEIIKTAISDISEVLGGHVAYSASGHVNEDSLAEGGDNVNLQISTLLSPDAPTPVAEPEPVRATPAPRTEQVDEDLDLSVPSVPGGTLLEQVTADSSDIKDPPPIVAPTPDEPATTGAGMGRSPGDGEPAALELNEPEPQRFPAGEVQDAAEMTASQEALLKADPHPEAGEEGRLTDEAPETSAPETATLGQTPAPGNPNVEGFAGLGEAQSENGEGEKPDAS
jgi:hypothetical protein